MENSKLNSDTLSQARALNWGIVLLCIYVHDGQIANHYLAKQEKIFIQEFCIRYIAH